MTQQDLSCQALRSFVQSHGLMDRHSMIHFTALVNIITTTNSLKNAQMNVRISLGDYQYGTVTLEDYTLDPYLYPTTPKALFSKIEHANDEYLLISDNHTANKAIGIYSIAIRPIQRLNP